MKTTDYAKVYFEPRTTPTGYGLAQDGCDIFPITPCCGRQVDFLPVDPECLGCNEPVAVPDGWEDMYNGICMGFDPKTAIYIRDWVALWTGHEGDDLTVVIT